MTMIFERRYAPFSWETRGGDLNHGATLYGYAALFDVLSQEMYGFRERIARGAFSKSIKEDDVRMLWNHDPNYVLARTKAGTLKLKEDDKGLYFEAMPPNTQFAKDLLVSIKRRDITQNSFGFTIKDEGLERKGDVKIRVLKSVKLFDISPVTFPAYLETELSVRGRWGETIITDKKRLRKFMERFDAEFFEAEGLKR